MIAKIALRLLIILNMNFVLIDLYSQDNQPPIPKWNMECKGSVFGIVTDMPDNDALRSNLNTLELDSLQSFNYHFEYGNFIPGQTKTVNWKLTVKNLNQDARAIIRFSDKQNNFTTITIIYYAINFSIEPFFYSFGNVPIGNTPEQEFTITNNSDNGTLRFNNVDFLFKNQNFEFRGVSFPIEIKPKEKYKLKIGFNAFNEGIFRDSAGLSDTCQSYFKVFLEAKVGTPIINVSDVAFGDVNVGGYTKKEIYLVNTGTTELVVNGFSGPKMDPIFKIELPRGITDISPQNPLKLNPGQRDTFMITFDPQTAMVYYDSVVFNSDAMQSDSIAVLSGRGIKSNVTVTAFYDWGKRMIDRRPQFPAGPYPPDNGENVIRLRNTGTKDVTITRLDSISSIKGYAFEFDRNIFMGLLLKAGEIKDIPVVFHPVETGSFELNLIYVNSESLPLQTKLIGTGTAPKINTDNYDFGSMAVGDVANIKSRSIVFMNELWEYSDTLTIFDFEVQPYGNEISTNINSFGTQGFRFNKKLIGIPDTPIKLAPGDLIEFKAEFLAQFSGNHSAILKSKSNSLEEKSSIWTGIGNVEGLRLIVDSTTICYNLIDTLDCIIRNEGMTLVDILSLKLEPDIPQFKILDSDLISGFTLPPNMDTIVHIVFNPALAKGRYTTDLIVDNSTTESKIQVKIIGNAIGFEPLSSSYVNKNKIDIKETLQYKIIYDSSDDIAVKNVSKFYIDIDYVSNFLLADISTLKTGNLLKDKFQIVNIDFIELSGNEDTNRITLTLQGIGGNTLSGYGDLIVLDFKTFLPWYSESDIKNGIKSTDVTIKHRIYGNEDRCIFFTSHNSDISLNTLSICAFNDRQIVIADRTNFIYVDDNSIGSDKLNFSIAFDGYTDIRLYNLSGNLIYRILSEELKAGRYSISLKSEIINNGLYFITISSSQYFEAIKLFVNR